MFLETLQVKNVRAIIQASLVFSPCINLIIGNNGAGKTSLLESIFLLGVGRSFRSNQIKTIINHQAEELTVFGKLSTPNNDALGISRDKSGNFKVRINNTEQNKLSSLARYLPVLVITPDSYKLLSAGPQYRRQFIDLSVFHVEQSFSEVWKKYNRVLKQRNAQLKQSKSYKDLLIWDKEFVKLSLSINEARKKEFLALIKHLKAIQSIFLPQYRVQYTYVSGWDTGSIEPLSYQLQESYNKDKRYGYSTIGAHKADLLITIDSVPVQEVLSRGEQKMLVNAMHIAQAERLSMDLSKYCLLLIDDLPSELDVHKQQILINFILKMKGVQFFIAAINKSEITNNNDSKDILIKMFHVEQGDVLEVSS